MLLGFGLLGISFGRPPGPRNHRPHPQKVHFSESCIGIRDAALFLVISAPSGRIRSALQRNARASASWSVLHWDLANVTHLAGGDPCLIEDKTARFRRFRRASG